MLQFVIRPNQSKQIEFFFVSLHRFLKFKICELGTSNTRIKL